MHLLMAHRNRLISGATILCIVAGLLVWATVGLFAENPSYDEVKDNSGSPALSVDPPQLPRPNEDGATTLDQASTELSSQPGLGSVIKAAESGDVSSLLGALKLGDYCSVTFRGGPAEECKDGKSHPAAFVESATTTPVLQPLELVERYVGSILSDSPVELTLVARDAGQGDNFYLVFKASQPTVLDGEKYDGLGIVVNPKSETPIQWVRFIIPENNGLEWLQIRASEADGSPRFDLVAPESIKDWPGYWGDKGH